jgi:hypothetical protein
VEGWNTLYQNGGPYLGVPAPHLQGQLAASATSTHSTERNSYPAPSSSSSSPAIHCIDSQLFKEVELNIRQFQCTVCVEYPGCHLDDTMSLPVPLEPWALASFSLLPHWKRAFCSLIACLKMCWSFMKCHVLDTFCASISVPLDL